MEKAASGRTVKTLVPSDRSKHIDWVNVDPLLLSERLSISSALPCLSLPPREHL